MYQGPVWRRVNGQTHFPTAGSGLSLSELTQKSMVWLPVAIFEHHEERGSAYASVTSFRERLYGWPGPRDGSLCLKAYITSKATRYEKRVSASYPIRILLVAPISLPQDRLRTSSLYFPLDSPGIASQLLLQRNRIYGSHTTAA
jgi:hypothetical protein